jgi:hypothetical protein
MRRNKRNTRLVRGDGFVLYNGFVYLDRGGVLRRFTGQTVEVEESVMGVEVYTLNGRYICEASRYKHPFTR